MVISRNQDPHLLETVAEAGEEYDVVVVESLARLFPGQATRPESRNRVSGDRRS